MIHYLETLKKYRDERGDYPAMFTDANISSVFGMLDVTNKGYITLDQYRAGLSLCIHNVQCTTFIPR